MAGFSQYHVRLFRDCYDTPWGFRLQGGKDLGQPLTIQRVFTGSPAEGELQRGDIILSISDRLAETLTHKQAQDLIKFGGGSINLSIQRPPPGRVNIAQPAHKPVQTAVFRPQKSKPMPKPKAGKIRNLGGHGPEFGSDFSQCVPQYGSVSQSRPGTNRNMLFQVQQSFESRGLSGQYDPEGVITTPQYTPMKPHSRQFQSLISEDFSNPQYSEPTPVYQSFTSSVQSYQPGPPDPEDDDYEVIPVSERKKAFMGDSPVRKWGNEPQTPLHISRAPRSAPKPRSPQPPSMGPDFGLDYSSVPLTPKWTPPVEQYRPSPPSPQPPFMSQTLFSPASGEIERPKIPAWTGSLRKTGVKQWEEDFQPDAYNPPQAPPPKAKPAQARSVPKQPKQAPVRTAQPFNPAPRTIPIQTQQGDEEGARVVHLQYNSPMGLYSNENVQETFDGQTRSMAPQQSGPGGQNEDGPRDWSQSTLCRMIQQDEHRSGGGRPAHSTSATTIQTSYQQPVHSVSFQPGDGGGQIGASDF